MTLLGEDYYIKDMRVEGVFHTNCFVKQVRVIYIVNIHTNLIFFFFLSTYV